MRPDNWNITEFLENQPDMDHEGIAVTLRLPESFIAFQGHFPDNPVLPAIYQGILAHRLINLATGIDWQCRGLKNGKFQQVILPNVTFQLGCTQPAKASESYSKCFILDKKRARMTSFTLLLSI